MLSWFIEKKLSSFERAFDYDLSYARYMLSASPKALIRFQRATQMAQDAGGLPKDVWFAARLVGIISEDCGPCTQLLVKMAEAGGVSEEVIRNVVAGDFERLPEPVSVVARFSLATLQRSTEADALRERVLGLYGKRGLVAIALGITASRLYPTVKFALGFGHTCKRVEVGGRTVPKGRVFSPPPVSDEAAA